MTSDPTKTALLQPLEPSREDSMKMFHFKRRAKNLPWLVSMKVFVDVPRHIPPPDPLPPPPPPVSVPPAVEPGGPVGGAAAVTEVNIVFCEADPPRWQ